MRNLPAALLSVAAYIALPALAPDLPASLTVAVPTAVTALAAARLGAATIPWLAGASAVGTSIVVSDVAVPTLVRAATAVAAALTTAVVGAWLAHSGTWRLAGPRDLLRYGVACLTVSAGSALLVALAAAAQVPATGSPLIVWGQAVIAAAFAFACLSPVVATARWPRRTDRLPELAACTAWSVFASAAVVAAVASTTAVPRGLLVVAALGALAAAVRLGVPATALQVAIVAGVAVAAAAHVEARADTAGAALASTELVATVIGAAILAAATLHDRVDLTSGRVAQLRRVLPGLVDELTTAISLRAHRGPDESLPASYVLPDAAWDGSTVIDWDVAADGRRQRRASRTDLLPGPGRGALDEAHERSPVPTAVLTIRPDGSPDGRLVSVVANDAMRRLLRVRGAGPCAPTLRSWVSPSSRGIAVAQLRAIIASGEPVARQAEIGVLRADGDSLNVHAHAARLDGHPSADVEIVVQLTDRTEWMRWSRADLERRVRDTSTGLLNRDGLVRALRGRSGSIGEPAAVLVCDIDDFQYVNDGIGQVAGDDFLAEVARRLGSALSERDVLARTGNDEFGMVCHGVADHGAARDLCARLLATVRLPWQVGDAEVRPSMSIGAVLIDSTDDPDEALRRAMVALRRAKVRGRGRVEVYDSAFDARLRRTIAIQRRLREALEVGGFELHYQPILQVADRKLVGVEALIRLRGDGEVFGPAEFVPHAEASGLVVPMGQWVAQQALRDAPVLRQMYPGIRIGFNVSPIQLTETDFAVDLLEMASQLGVSPSWIAVEITEEALMDTDHALSALDELHAAGVHLCLDDFGTGQSSLARLASVPVDTVKIDRSFVRASLDSERWDVILRSIVDTSHALGLDVVAEGIETQSQHHAMLALGCDGGQGFLFGRPVPLAEAHWPGVAPVGSAPSSVG